LIRTSYELAALNAVEDAKDIIGQVNKMTLKKK